MIDRPLRSEMHARQHPDPWCSESAWDQSENNQNSDQSPSDIPGHEIPMTHFAANCGLWSKIA